MLVGCIQCIHNPIVPPIRGKLARSSINYHFARLARQIFQMFILLLSVVPHVYHTCLVTRLTRIFFSISPLLHTEGAHSLAVFLGEHWRPSLLTRLWVHHELFRFELSHLTQIMGICLRKYLLRVHCLCTGYVRLPTAQPLHRCVYRL